MKKESSILAYQEMGNTSCRLVKRKYNQIVDHIKHNLVMAINSVTEGKYQKALKELNAFNRMGPDW